MDTSRIGYELTDPEFVAARHEAAQDPAILQLFDRATQRAKNVVDIMERRRRPGVRMSGMDDEIIPFKTPAELLAEAKSARESTIRFLSTPKGQFFSALQEAERQIEVAYIRIQQAREAYDRGFPAGAEHARNHADDARAAAEEAALHLSSAHQIAEDIRVAAYEATRKR